MKKLMTMLSAVAMAFGLHATSPSDTGTSFEGLAAGGYDIYENGSTAALGGELIQLVDPGDTYWVTNETSELPELTIVAETSISQAAKRPERYELADQDKYLKIKTTLGNPVTRNVNLDGSETAIGDGFYFDSLVRFTAFDSDPTIDLGNDGKLAIWLREELENDVPVATNLVLTAGYIDESLGTKVVQTNYTCTVDSSVNLNDGGWHRVTVKAIDSIYSTLTIRPGFVVFIDGKYVMSAAPKGIVAADLTPMASSYNQDGAVFPSAVQLGSDATKRAIKSVSFDGQGDVDDLVFTAKAPAFADVAFYELRLGENVASVTYDAKDSNGTTYDSGTITSASPAKSIEYKEGMYVIVSDVQYATGYMSNGVLGVQPDETDGSFVPTAADQFTTFLAKTAGASVNGVPYETLADAFSAVASSSATEFTVQLTSDADLGSQITLNKVGATVLLDLAGNNIVRDGTVALAVANGTLVITNSTQESVGHIQATQTAAREAGSGNLIIRGGYYDGGVILTSATRGDITGGGFAIANNAANLATLNTAVPEGYELAAEAGESPVYYVITEKQGPTTVLVNFINGELIVASTNIEVGTTLVAPEVSKTGYTLSGWFYGDPAVAWNFADTVSEAMTLTAGWTINTYTVTFMVDGVEVDTETADYNTTLDIKPENPSKSGYSFEGWSTDGTAASIVDLDEYLVVDDVTLYAVWEEKHDAGAAFDPPSGYTAESFAAAINNGSADIADYLAIPAGVSSSSNYCDLFKATNINDKVEFVLNETAEAAVAAEANAAAATIVATPGTVPGTLTIDAEPGLYYSISYGTSLSNMSEGDRTQATDTGSDPTVENGTITLDMPTPALGATSGFYKVIVSIADKPAPEPDQGQD